MRSIVCVLAGAIGASVLPASSPGGPEGMDCRQVIVVEYHPGPNWAKFNDHISGHLDFLRRQMKSGRLLFAGPWVDDGGGLSVYGLADQHEADALVQSDPLLAHKVVTHSLHTWRMCTASSEPASTATE